MPLSVLNTTNVVAAWVVSKYLPPSSNEIFALTVPLKMAKEHLCFNYPCMNVCFCNPLAFVCALMSIFMKNVCSYEDVLYGHRMKATHFRNVCGSLVLQEFYMWCGCRRKAAPFCLCVCLCVVWSQAGKSLSSHGNK